MPRQSPHPNGTPTSATTIRNELTQNDTFANQRRLPNYFKDSMVQPDISGLNTAVSGLNDSLAQQTAYNWGIRNWIDDTSRTGWNNPSPNVGNTHEVSLPSLRRT